MEPADQETTYDHRVRLPQPGQAWKEVKERYTHQMIEDKVTLFEEFLLNIFKGFEAETGFKIKRVELELGLTSTVKGDPWILQGVKIITERKEDRDESI